MDLPKAGAIVCERALQREGGYVCATPVHAVMEGYDDPSFREVLNRAFLVVPDGMPVAWGLRLKGHRGQPRVSGPDLMLEVCRQAAERGLKIGLYGSSPECLELLKERLPKIAPGIQVVYTYSPPFRALSLQEDSEIVQAIRDSGTEILFVGLGCPKQERWMQQHQDQLSAVMLGVGAAFDFHAGLLPRAPEWMRSSGLEWVYRLSQEPRRLWWRYLKHNPRFMYRVLGEWVRRVDRPPYPGHVSQLCGFKLQAVGYAQAVDLLANLLRRREGAWVLTLNLEILSNARLNPDYRQLVMQADLVLADGMPLVWASRLKRGVPAIPERTTGADLSADLIQRVAAHEVAIIGGENPPKALEVLRVERSDEVFVFDGTVPSEGPDLDALLREVKAHGARLIFVALGVPKQDRVARRIRDLIPDAVTIGVGGTFELIAGIKPRAPKWMRDTGLEWLFRLYLEPRRLWRRYLVLYWVGLASLAHDTLRGKRPDVLPGPADAAKPQSDPGPG